MVECARKGLRLLGSLVVIIALVSGAARSMAHTRLDDSNLFDGGASVFVPFVGGPAGGNHTPAVWLQVGDVQSNAPLLFSVDTGSTGIEISADLFQPTTADQLLERARTIHFSSSGVIWRGDVYRTRVRFLNAGHTQELAVAEVRVLRVRERSCYKIGRLCTASKIGVWRRAHGVHYAGIGFATDVGYFPDSATMAANNAATSLKLLRGRQLPADFHPGYLIEPAGLTLGLQSAAMHGMAWVKLTGTPGEKAIWQRPPVGLHVHRLGASPEVSADAEMLSDSGIGLMYLALPGCGLHQLSAGSQVEVSMGGGQDAQGPGYSFVIGDAQPLTPQQVVIPADSRNYLNTGRRFFLGFSYAYDPVDGMVGYRGNPGVIQDRLRTPPSFTFNCRGGCDFSPPPGFATTLPLLLRSDLRLHLRGVAILAGPVRGPGQLLVDGGPLIRSGSGRAHLP